MSSGLMYVRCWACAELANNIAMNSGFRMASSVAAHEDVRRQSPLFGIGAEAHFGRDDSGMEQAALIDDHSVGHRFDRADLLEKGVGTVDVAGVGPKLRGFGLGHA